MLCSRKKVDDILHASGKTVTSNTAQVLENIWSIGGERGWYYGNKLWQIRGFIDKLFGGMGLRRGRTNENIINTGDSLDFWVLLPFLWM